MSDDVQDPWADAQVPPQVAIDQKPKTQPKRKPVAANEDASKRPKKKQKHFDVVKDWTMVVRPSSDGDDAAAAPPPPPLPPPDGQVPQVAMPPPPPPPPEPCSLTEDWDWEAEEREDRQKEQDWKDERDAAIAEGMIPERQVHDALSSIGIRYVPEQDPMMDNDGGDQKEWLPLKCFFCDYGIMDQHSDEILRLTNKFIEDVRTADEQVVCKAVSKHIQKEYGRIERFQTPAWLVKKHFVAHGAYSDYMCIIQDKTMNAALIKLTTCLGVRVEKDKRPQIDPQVLTKFLALIKERNAVIRTRTTAGRASAGGGGGGSGMKS
jgi:hypothetical protein